MSYRDFQEIAFTMNQILNGWFFPVPCKHTGTVEPIDEIFLFTVVCSSSKSEILCSDDCKVEYLVEQHMFGKLPIDRQRLLDAPVSISNIRYPCELDYIDSLVKETYLEFNRCLCQFGLYVQSLCVVPCRKQNSQVFIYTLISPENCKLIVKKTGENLCDATNFKPHANA